MKLSQALRITYGDVVAFVGGGGKTTAMFQLAAELAHQKMRVLTTTTTRIFAAQINHAPAHVIFDPTHQNLADILPQLKTALDKHHQVLLIGQSDPTSGKAFGIEPETINILAATGHFDVILNEADGSRMRAFKAPAEHEPVIPLCTTLLVPVVGLDILGQPLNNITTHRAERVSHLSETPLDQPITADTIAKVMGHTNGALKNVPLMSRIIPLINKVESPSQQTSAQNIATKILKQDRIEAVLMGAVQNSKRPILETHSRIAAVILAAGGSSRFGSPKQLALWGDKTFIEHSVNVALASLAQPVIVVLGAEIEQSQKLLSHHHPLSIIVNDDWAKGQSTSMKVGLTALPPNVGGVLFLLVDMPGITPGLINALIKRHQQTLAPLIWPEFEGKRGNPLLFDRSLFDELQQIRGDTGGRPVLLAHQDQAERVVVETEGILQDFDRPEDLNHSY